MPPQPRKAESSPLPSGPTPQQHLPHLRFTSKAPKPFPIAANPAPAVTSLAKLFTRPLPPNRAQSTANRLDKNLPTPSALGWQNRGPRGPFVPAHLTPLASNTTKAKAAPSASSSQPTSQPAAERDHDRDPALGAEPAMVLDPSRAALALATGDNKVLVPRRDCAAAEKKPFGIGVIGGRGSGLA